MLAANSAVKPPTQLIINNPVPLYSINGDNLINKYTPAVHYRANGLPLKFLKLFRI